MTGKYACFSLGNWTLLCYLNIKSRRIKFTEAYSSQVQINLPARAELGNRMGRKRSKQQEFDPNYPRNDCKCEYKALFAHYSHYIPLRKRNMTNLID